MELALPPEWPPGLPTDRPLTAAEVMQLPEGPPYFELHDGDLVVNPSPTPKHQLVARSLLLVLHAACPPDLQVLFAPLDWIADEANVFEPDLLVVDLALETGRWIEHPPKLCVEILSPSTRRIDLVRKRRSYERSGVDAYWIVDPDGDDGPELRVLHLVEGTYGDVARVRGPGAVWTTDRPFPVTVEPARLLD